MTTVVQQPRNQNPCCCWNLYDGGTLVGIWTLVYGLTQLALFGWQISVTNIFGNRFPGNYQFTYQRPTELFHLLLSIAQVVHIASDVFLVGASVGVIIAVQQRTAYLFWPWFPSMIINIASTAFYCGLWWSQFFEDYWRFITIVEAIVIPLNIYCFCVIVAAYRAVRRDRLEEPYLLKSSSPMQADYLEGPPPDNPKVALVGSSHTGKATAGTLQATPTKQMPYPTTLGYANQAYTGSPASIGKVRAPLDPYTAASLAQQLQQSSSDDVSPGEGGPNKQFTVHFPKEMYELPISMKKLVKYADEEPQPLRYRKSRNRSTSGNRKYRRSNTYDDSETDATTTTYFDASRTRGTETSTRRSRSSSRTSRRSRDRKSTRCSQCSYSDDEGTVSTECTSCHGRGESRRSKSRDGRSRSSASVRSSRSRSERGGYSEHGSSHHHRHGKRHRPSCPHYHGSKHSEKSASSVRDVKRRDHRRSSDDQAKRTSGEQTSLTSGRFTATSSVNDATQTTDTLLRPSRKPLKPFPMPNANLDPYSTSITIPQSIVIPGPPTGSETDTSSSGGPRNVNINSEITIRCDSRTGLPTVEQKRTTTPQNDQVLRYAPREV